MSVVDAETCLKRSSRARLDRIRSSDFVISAFGEDILSPGLQQQLIDREDVSRICYSPESLGFAGPL